jgi:hypothetical protein
MSISISKHTEPLATDVRIDDTRLTIQLQDGRTLTVPILWYPRLAHGTPAERSNWQIIAGGEGIHWPALDEDLSVRGLLEGRPSAESQRSFKKWLAARRPEQTG